MGALSRRRDRQNNHRTPLLPTAMKLRFSTGIATLVCVLLASCYPYDENTGRKKPGKKPEMTAAEQAKAKEEEAKKKAEEDLKKKADQAQNGTTTPPEGGTTTGTPGGTPPPTEGPKPPTTEPKRNDYAFANKVPGKEGFVFSPYNNKVVDVRDIPSGTLVQDPTYPASEKKYFRVP